MSETENRQALNKESQRIKACSAMNDAANKLNDDLKEEAKTRVGTNITHHEDNNTFSCPEGAPENIQNDVKALNAAIAKAKALGGVQTGITETANVTRISIPDGAKETPIPNPYQKVFAARQ